MKNSTKAVFLGVLAALALSTASTIAVARDQVSWSVSVGTPYSPGYAPGVIYTQQPVYVEPQPIYVRPQPVYVRPAPIVQYQPYYVNPYPQLYYVDQSYYRGYGHGHHGGRHGEHHGNRGHRN